MFTRMKLENFKSWQSLDIEMAPLTILFGTNSSGKSSVLQAILLLLQSFEKADWQNIDFGGGQNDYINLGGFREVVFNHELIRTIEIQLDLSKYRGWSKEWVKNIIEVTMKYKNDDVIFKPDVHDSFIDIMTDIIFNDDPAIHYLGPLRQHPQRSYLWSGAAPHRIESDGGNTLAVLIESTRHDGILIQKVAEWLTKMELVKSFRVNPLDEGKRFYEPLVDVAGVETALLDVGFGVSQVLPVVTTLFFVPEGSIVLLEQPELHLHPRAQAHLADLMLHVAETRRLQLIVESHSEHLLRRLQRRIAEVEQEFASPENVRMYFCDSGETGSTIQAVEVDIYGQISNWPDKFFGDITGDLEAMTMAALQRSMNGKN